MFGCGCSNWKVAAFTSQRYWIHGEVTQNSFFSYLTLITKIICIRTSSEAFVSWLTWYPRVCGALKSRHFSFSKQMESELSSPKHHRFPLSFVRKCLTTSVKILFGSVGLYRLGLVSVFPLTTSFQVEQVAFYCLAVQAIISRYVPRLQDFFLFTDLLQSPESDKETTDYFLSWLAK